MHHETAILSIKHIWQNLVLFFWITSRIKFMIILTLYSCHFDSFALSEMQDLKTRLIQFRFSCDQILTVTMRSIKLERLFARALIFVCVLNLLTTTVNGENIAPKIANKGMLFLQWAKRCIFWSEIYKDKFITLDLEGSNSRLGEELSRVKRHHYRSEYYSRRR